MATFINIDGTIINLEKADDWFWDESESALCVNYDGVECTYRYTSDNARRAYEWLRGECVATFTDASEVKRERKEVRFKIINPQYHVWNIKDSETGMFLERFNERPAKRNNTGWTHSGFAALSITERGLTQAIVDELNAWEPSRESETYT